VKTTTRVKNVQCFTGFYYVYRIFINGVRQIARLLYQLTEKNQKWEWREKEQ